MNALLRQVLVSVRSLCDRAIAALDAIPPEEDCAHPAEARLDIATMGDPGAFICRDCEAEVHPSRIPETLTEAAAMGGHTTTGGNAREG